MLEQRKERQEGDIHVIVLTEVKTAVMVQNMHAGCLRTRVYPKMKTTDSAPEAEHTKKCTKKTKKKQAKKTRYD